MKPDKIKGPCRSENKSLTGTKSTPHPAAGQPNLGGAILPSAEKGSDVMLTKEELAVRLNVAVRTIENWQADGLLPYLKIAYIVRFYWPEVLDHLNTHFRVDVNGKFRPKA